MWNQVLGSIVALASLATAIAIESLEKRDVLDDRVLDRRQLHGGEDSILNDHVIERRQQPGGQQPGAVSADVFLRRAYHSSTIVDKYLYIDGGQISYQNNGTPTYQRVDSILSLDMTQDWKNDTVVLTPIDKPTWAPLLSYGSLWYHESEKLIYTGVDGISSSFNRSDSPAPLSVATFKPDGAGSGTWAQVLKSGDPAFKGVTRPQRASSTNGLNVGISMNGGSADAWIPGVLTFSMNDKKFTNASAAAAGPVFWRGSLHYVPIYGSRGIMIPLGGTNQGNEKPRPFTTLTIYDPATQKWYNQTTTGNAPAGRVDACVAGAPSANGTWEIFVYGGSNSNLGTQSIPFDTINILTLPAFHWISVPYNPQNPRHGMTCHGVGGSQILVVGGADSNPKQPTGTYNEVGYSKLENPDPWKQGLGVFDLTTFSWNDHYSAKPPAYVWSEPLKEYYAQAGGVPATADKLDAALKPLLINGDFTKITPGLSTLMRSPNATNSTTSTTTSTSSSSHTGAIVGGVVGGIAALALIAAATFFFLRRRRNRTRKHDYTHTETQSLEEMYKTGSGGGSWNGEGDPPPQYVFKDGQWMQTQPGAGGEGGVMEVDGNERTNLFEADGREGVPVVHEADGQGLGRGRSQRETVELPT